MNPELERLLAGLCDGTSNEADRESLGAMIAADPTARHYYLEYVDLHAALAGPMGVALPDTVEVARLRRRWWIPASAIAFAAAAVVIGVTLWLGGKLQRAPEPEVARQPALHLVEFGGRAEFSDDAGHSTDALQGWAVQPGQTLRTDAGDGYAILDFGNGSWLQLSPEAQLKYAISEKLGEIKVFLSAGVLRGEVKATDRLTVVTPQAEFHPNDTRFLISATAPNIMETESESASVFQPTATFKAFADWGLAFTSETALVARLKTGQYSALNIERETPSAPLPSRVDDATAVGLSGDGSTFYRVEKSGTITLWNTETNLERLRIAVGGVAARWPWTISHDGSTLAAAHVISGPAIEVWFWDARSGEQLKTGKPTLTPRIVALSADGKFAAWGIDNRRKQLPLLEVWDIVAGKMVSTVELPDKPLRLMAFSPDGLSIAGATESGTVHLWDCATGRMRNTFLPIGSSLRPVSALAFSHTGKLLAAGRSDGRVEVWEVQTGQERLAIQPGSRSVTALAFSPSDRSLAVGLLRQPTTVWVVPPSD